MGLFSSDIQGILDPLDLGGSGAAQSTIETAEQGAAEQRRQFDIAQQNIQPFLDVSLAQIPRLQEAGTREGFISNLLDVQSSIPEAFGSVIGGRGDAARQAAESAGLNISPQAIQEISQLPPDVQNALVFDLEQELNRRSQELFAPGTTTGIEFGRLGAQSASGIGNTLTQGLLSAQQARSAGMQNLATIGGGIAGLFSGGGQTAAPQQQNLGAPINVTDFSNIA